jgi:hypothetical protein
MRKGARHTTRIDPRRKPRLDPTLLCTGRLKYRQTVRKLIGEVQTEETATCQLNISTRQGWLNSGEICAGGKFA